ncbi:2-oxo acid dehydrogenase subunit E2 [Teredinibacter purpureus]|uniref:2-oxo acid dehydrogenase subunit E2 n=1 Tax=Teredinibacter purpureus TaxID=2731756 RepID=UPI0005F84163|nr:2-oxo acid dehydrogenase subunit E2 [Teredinibacter purpureus]
MVDINDFPQQRRHTYYFLKDASNTAPVLLTTKVDMSAMEKSRASLKTEGVNVSYIAFLIKAISVVIKQYPQANASMLDGWRPKIARYERVIAKFTLDKHDAGERLVASAVIEDSDLLGEYDIQREIERFKNADYSDADEYNNLRRLNSLKKQVGQWLYRKLMSNPNKRHAIQGSFTITSLGHRPVDVFCPISSNCIAFGVGAIQDSAVVMGGEITVRPMLPLSMVFDHRVIDGAMAADILHDIKNVIEQYQFPLK